MPYMHTYTVIVCRCKGALLTLRPNAVNMTKTNSSTTTTFMINRIPLDIDDNIACKHMWHWRDAVVMKLPEKPGWAGVT